ncbi:hypothetical protein [Pseudoxanthomonas suwonensis]|uniref:hypothetical protein n=1 Tax=Pseudoxanthomonas suwonensis TaxID=314722 RepID=UPI0006880BD2|nr:hypothetical protein [Pseudoxanthomonas suwonensis]
MVGDKPVGQVDRNDLRAFWDGVRWWPANATVKREYQGLTVQNIIAKGKAADVPAPAPNTMKKHRQRLSVFFNDLVEAGTLSKSPITSKMLKVESGEAETGRPFTEAELRRIFDPATFLPWAKKSAHRFWGPILGLYSGARVTEVAQLYVADIEQVAGCFDP